MLRGGLADGDGGAGPARPGGYMGSLNPGQLTGSVLKVCRDPRSTMTQPAFACQTGAPGIGRSSAQDWRQETLGSFGHLHTASAQSGEVLVFDRMQSLTECHDGVQAAGSLRLTRGPGAGAGGNPFFRLLRTYLQHLLPRAVPGSPSPQRPNSAHQIFCQATFGPVWPRC